MLTSVGAVVPHATRPSSDVFVVDDPRSRVRASSCRSLAVVPVIVFRGEARQATARDQAVEDLIGEVGDERLADPGSGTAACARLSSSRPSPRRGPVRR